MTANAKKSALFSAARINYRTIWFQYIDSRFIFTRKALGMRLFLLSLFMLFTVPLCAQTSATLSTAQYRAIYNAAQLIEAADACELDWKLYHEAFVNAQKKKALAEGWSLGTQARATLQLREIRTRIAAQLSRQCSQERQDSLAIRLEVEKERLTAEVDPDDDNWVLKPRGKNWLYIQRLTTRNSKEHFDLISSPGAREAFRRYQLSDNWGIMHGKVNWINQLPGSEKRFSKRWLAPTDGVSPNISFLNMRPLIYQDEDIDVLVAQATGAHPLFKQALAFGRSGDIGRARELLETLEEDSYVNTLPEYWLIRAYLEDKKGSPFRAHEYLKAIAKIRKVGSQAELMMRHQITALGKSSDLNWGSSFLGLVLEFAWEGRIEILAMYVDGSIILANSDGGGLIVEPIINQFRMWDVQAMALKLIRRKSPFADTPLGISRFNEVDRTLPNQGTVRLSFLNGTDQINEEYELRVMEEDKSDFWLGLNRLYTILWRAYESAEIDR